MGNGVLLIGFMGAGKSSVAKALGSLWKFPVADTDAYIERCENQSISAIFAEKGEEYFRDLESEALEKLSQSPGAVATGGGIILRKKNRKLLKDSGRSVFLKCGPDELLRRLEQDKSRPLIQGKGVSERLDMYRSRMPMYESAANYVVYTDGKTVDEVAAEIAALLH